MSRKQSNGSYITDIKGVRPIATLTGGPPPLWSFPELSGTQTFKAGCAVQLSGTLAGAKGLTTADALNAGTYAGSGYGILGFAADDATGVTSSFKGVWLATPSVVFEGNVNNVGTSANAQTAATDLGECFGLRNLSGIAFVDKAQTSADARVRVIGFSDEDDVPCFYGKVHFVLLPGECQVNKYMASAPWSFHGTI